MALTDESLAATLALSGTGIQYFINGADVIVQQTGVRVTYNTNPLELVFKPGAPTSTLKANVFNDWATLYSACDSILGTLTIFFDSSLVGGAITIPAGVWTFTQQQVTFLGANSGSSAGFARDHR